MSDQRALMNALVICSDELQRAHTIARREGREDLCQQLRRAQWQVVAALSDLVPDSAQEMAS
jgi:hypothetical protein